MTRMADHKAQIDHTCLQVGLTAGVIKTGTYSLMSKEHSPLRKQFLNTVKTYFRGWTLCPPVPKCQRKLKNFPRGWSNHMKNEFSHATRYAAHKKQNLAKIIISSKKIIIPIPTAVAAGNLPSSPLPLTRLMLAPLLATPSEAVPDPPVMGPAAVDPHEGAERRQDPRGRERARESGG